MSKNGGKELVPIKFGNEATSGSFKAWAREMQDYAGIAQPSKKQFFDIAEKTVDKITIEDLPVDKKDIDQDLHYLVSRFLDGQAKLIALNAEIGLHILYK